MHHPGVKRDARETGRRKPRGTKGPPSNQRSTGKPGTQLSSLPTLGFTSKGTRRATWAKRHSCMLYAVAVVLFMCGGVVTLVGRQYRLIACSARCFLGVRSCGGGSQTVFHSLVSAEDFKPHFRALTWLLTCSCLPVLVFLSYEQSRDAPSSTPLTTARN